jgi:hypothetical protein
MKFVAGWGESLSLGAVPGAETVTPPRLAFRFAQSEPTLPLQGRVRACRVQGDYPGFSLRSRSEPSCATEATRVPSGLKIMPRVRPRPARALGESWA